MKRAHRRALQEFVALFVWSISMGYAITTLINLHDTFALLAALALFGAWSFWVANFTYRLLKKG